VGGCVWNGAKKKKKIKKRGFFFFPFGGGGGGGGIFYGTTFNIFKSPLGQQQNLNEPPKRNVKTYVIPSPHPLYKCKQFKQCSIKELFWKKQTLI